MGTALPDEQAMRSSGAPLEKGCISCWIYSGQVAEEGEKRTAAQEQLEHVRLGEGIAEHVALQRS